MAVSVPMIDRKGSGEQVGQWLHVGSQVLDMVDGKDMYCDYVPFNNTMSCISTTYFMRNQRGEKEYWHFHLPGAQGRRVRLHRQLYEDCAFFFHGSAPLTLKQDVHHAHGMSVHHNCLDSLEVMSKGRHTQLHARQRARGPNHMAYQRPRHRGRRPRASGDR